MKYNIQINQKAIIDSNLNLTLEEAVILDFCMQFVNSPLAVKIYHNNSMYVWISHNLILENLPILKLKKDSIYRKMKELCEKEFLTVHPETQKLGRSYYSIGNNANKLIFAPSEENPNPRIKTNTPTEINPKPYGNKSEAHSEEYPNYNSINYNTINNNNIIDNNSFSKKEPKKVSDKKDNTTFIFSNDITSDLINSITSYFDYRKEIKKPFKSQKAIDAKISQFTQQAKEYGEQAVIQSISNAIANQYQGTFIDKQYLNKSQTQLIDENGNYAKSDAGRELFYANVAKGATDAIRAMRNGERDDFWLRISNAKPK